jgi:hypothetical protein
MEKMPLIYLGHWMHAGTLAEGKTREHKCAERKGRMHFHFDACSRCGVGISGNPSTGTFYSSRTG